MAPISPLTPDFDDGIVVGKVGRKWKTVMLDMSARQWKQDVLEVANDKFERRLSEETGALKLEIAAIRLDIAKSHNSLLRWMFGFWLTTMLGFVELARIISGR